VWFGFTVPKLDAWPLIRFFQAELGRSPVLVDQSAEDLMVSDWGVEAGHDGWIMVGRVLVRL
jgi:hypothetical protein